MLSSNMFMGKSFRFLGSVCQHTLALITKRKIHRSGNLLPNCGVPFNLLADRLHRSMRPQEAVREGFIFAQQAQQKMLRLYIRRPELACLIARKEYYAPRFFCITLEHKP